MAKKGGFSGIFFYCRISQDWVLPAAIENAGLGPCLTPTNIVTKIFSEFFKSDVVVPVCALLKRYKHIKIHFFRINC